MKRYALHTLALVLVLLLAGCSLRKPTAPSTQEETADALQELRTERTISRTETINGKTISVQATFSPVTADHLYSVTLESDREAWEAMARNILQNRFPDADGSQLSENTDVTIYVDGQPKLSFDFGYGRSHFFDWERNLNGDRLDPDGASYIPYYITSAVPSGMKLTAEDAAQQVIEQFRGYTCFDFIPWNVYANYDSRSGQGDYGIKLQYVYEDLPIYAANWGHTLYAFYSEDGLFEYQGSVHMKETERHEIAVSCTLEDAVEQFFAMCPVFSYGQEIICQEIRLGYLLSADSNGTTLSPAWIFVCQDTQFGHAKFTADYTCGFRLEDGKLQVNTGSG